jgi:hypothetical protein
VRLDLLTEQLLVAILDEIPELNPPIDIQRHARCAARLEMRLILADQTSIGPHGSHASLRDGAQCSQAFWIVKGDCSHVRQREPRAIQLVDNGASLANRGAPRTLR